MEALSLSLSFLLCMVEAGSRAQLAPGWGHHWEPGMCPWQKAADPGWLPGAGLAVCDACFTEMTLPSFHLGFPGSSDSKESAFQ